MALATVAGLVGGDCAGGSGLTAHPTGRPESRTSLPAHIPEERQPGPRTAARPQADAAGVHAHVPAAESGVAD